MAESLREQIQWFVKEGQFLKQYRQTTIADYALSLIAYMVKRMGGNDPLAQAIIKELER